MVFQRKKIGGSRKDKILELHIHFNKFKKGTHKEPDDQGKEDSLNCMGIDEKAEN